MNQEAVAIAEDMLREHEGRRSQPYQDHLGNLTIGIGRLLGRGLSDDEIEYLFSNDVDEAIRTVQALPYINRMNVVRTAALMDMAFQLGAPKLDGFKRMHHFLDQENYAAAATEVLNSRYARQVPQRAAKIAKLIRTGDE